MKPIRVLVVEDSLTVRKLLCEIIASDARFELVGEAEDGKRAIELCLARRPDVISMDMMLPQMSGLAVTEYVMAHCPTPILIVSSSHNRGDVFKTYEALAAGAVDVMEKPLADAPQGSWEQGYVDMLALVSRIRVITHPRARLPQLREAPPQKAGGHPYRLVAIGASTGGPRAIVEVLNGLPTDLRVPILVVLHIADPFGSDFADWLDAQVDQPVRFAQQGGHLAPGVHLAPPGRHLVVERGLLRLVDWPERHSCRPSVDVLFESIAADCGRSVAACLLTGMGTDGALGLLAIRRAGGLTIAQDEATSVVYGMPREAAVLGAAQYVQALGEIGPTLAANLREHRE